MKEDFRAVSWDGRAVTLIDQKELPLIVSYVKCETAKEVADRIRDLTVRGAPAIGIAAAAGVALEALNSKSEKDSKAAIKRITEAASMIEKTRPTAVNLFKSTERLKRKALSEHEKKGASCEIIADALSGEVHRMIDEQIEADLKMAKNGASLIAEGSNLLTHCNAGGLATVFLGTALGVIKEAHGRGLASRVFVDETRPVLQGARLTMWELVRAGIDAELICDNMAGWLMSKGMIDYVIVGADRITLNGDVANKIGTYSLAVLARYHGVKFFVVAPGTTIDDAISEGRDIPIEERDTEEVTEFFGKRSAPKNVKALNPSFDITPSCLVDAIITEAGVLNAPYSESIKELINNKG